MFQIKGNQITFQRYNKPSAIKDAQREVREAYLILCNQELSRSTPLAKAFLIDTYSKGDLARLSLISPTIIHSLSSAAKAYSTIGNSLQDKRMYHMNVTIPSSALRALPDVPPELISEAESRGLAELIFVARELPPGPNLEWKPS